ncbi:MAG: hypothetical protein P1S46_02910 [bacterium]|nr:hypothetical protein [bacterium]
MDYGDAWITTGVMLGEYLGNARGEPVTIALTPAGAIPYYSKLRTIDMLGLNDRGVAENGLHAPQNAAGHQLVAPISYLRDRGVNLLLGHPATYDTAADPRVYLEKAISRVAFMSEANIRQLSPVVRIVEIPVLKNRKIVAVYLNDHEHIDRLITTGTFRSYQVEIMESHTRKTFHKTAAVLE